MKQTVNFDAPDTYHLYDGDEIGRPGSILTFFPWPGAPRGRRGTGQATTTSFSIPEASLGWWKRHLGRKGVEVVQAVTRFDEDALAFEDSDGLLLELVAHTGTDPRPPWEQGPIPHGRAIRGLYSVTLSESGYESTAAMLIDTLGFRLIDESGSQARFEVAGGGPGNRVDVLCQPEALRGRVSAGTVHHVAWRAPDEAAQAQWREAIVGTGLNVTPVLDRNYFRSIYFREPGGVLFEIATDAPGFVIDEPLLELGRRLQLPPWLEPKRADIEAALPELRRHHVIPARAEPDAG